MKKRTFDLAVPLLLFFGAVAIGLALPSNHQQDGFAIHVFEFRYDSEKLLSLEDVQALLENNPSVLTRNDLAKADVIITEEDILTYDWATQKIVLSGHFRERYLSEQPLLSDGSVFMASFKGKSLFSGMVLMAGSPLHLETPILYVSHPLLEPGEEGLIVYLRPHSEIYLEDEESEFPIADRELAEEIRAHLEMNGK